MSCSIDCVCERVCVFFLFQFNYLNKEKTIKKKIGKNKNKT